MSLLELNRLGGSEDLKALVDQGSRDFWKKTKVSRDWDYMKPDEKRTDEPRKLMIANFVNYNMRGR